MRKQAARHDHETSRVLIQPMDNSAARQLVEPRIMMQQGVLQCSVRMPRSRVHDQASWLIDDDQMLVLEDNLQRDRLRHTVAARLNQGLNLHLLSTMDAILRPRLAAIDQHPTLLDPDLQTAARECRQQLGEHLIKPASGVLRLQSQSLQAKLLRPSLIPRSWIGSGISAGISSGASPTGAQLTSFSSGHRNRLRGLGLFCDSHDDSVYWRDCDADDGLGDNR